MFNYKWYLKDNYEVDGIDKHGLTVFSTFSCGGGSSMGYKLAGYNVVGANDIDPKMQAIYTVNHKPEFYHLGSISELKTIDLPDKLFNLDILDGSPPCSTFSAAGLREKAWKVKKKFREGQSKQVLSDLFFEFIDVVERLQPKVVVAENVKGIISGNAKLYTLEIVKRLDEIGYDTDIFLLNARNMGVPQSRGRVFFVGRRKDLNLPKLNLHFNQPVIPFSKIETDEDGSRPMSEFELEAWYKREYGDSKLAQILVRNGQKGNRYTTGLIYKTRPVPTIIANDNNILFHKPRKLSDTELKLASSFPLDYNFLNQDVRYIVGMSVPPVMMANVAHQIYLQLFKDNEKDIQTTKS